MILRQGGNFLRSQSASHINLHAALSQCLPSQNRLGIEAHDGDMAERLKALVC